MGRAAHRGSRPLRPTSGSLDRSREKPKGVIRRSTYLKPFSTGRAETCASPSLSLSLSSRKQVASLRAQRGHIRFSPSCFCSFRHLSSNSSLLFVTDITAHNRVRYFCSRTNRTNREGVEQITLYTFSLKYETKDNDDCICVFNLSRSIY